MGGALGLELPRTGNFPHAESPCCAYVSSGRAALQVLLENLPEKPRRVLVPRFVCDTVLQPMRRLGIPVARYHGNDRLHPELPNDLAEDDVLLLVDYFGLTGPAVEQAAAQHRGLSVVDATTALFASPPLPRFYSPRKFCGVADGGVACAATPFRTLPAGVDLSSPRAAHLMVQLESGTRRAAPLVDAAETDLDREPMAMSPLTRRLLDAYDFNLIARRRMQNYAALHRLLGPINRLELPETPPAAPFCYPLVSGIPDLRDSLVDAGVALPFFWPEVVKATGAESVENRLARTLLPLPIDQRYSPEDMQRLASLVLRG